jgi:uncharacterized membrane protein required for colicin V production
MPWLDTTMHWLDTTLLAALGLGAILGFVSGLFWQLARLASLALAVFATIFFHEAAAHTLRDWLLRDADPSILQASAYVTVFLTVYVALFLVTRVLRMWLRATDMALPDRLLGAVLGTGKVAVLLGLGCLLLRHAAHPKAQEFLDRSLLAPIFARGMDRTLTLVPDSYKQPVFDSLRQLQEGMRNTKQARNN